VFSSEHFLLARILGKLLAWAVQSSSTGGLDVEAVVEESMDSIEKSILT